MLSLKIPFSESRENLIDNLEILSQSLIRTHFKSLFAELSRDWFQVGDFA